MPRHRESTTCSIQTINGFLLTVTCSQNLALYRHWYNRSPWARRTFLWAKGLVTILLWLKVTMKWSGHCNDYISNGVNVSWINEYVNIWGSNFFNCTSLTIQRSPSVLARRGYNSRIRGCEFDGRPGEVNYQNNFREYGVVWGAECGFFLYCYGIILPTEKHYNPTNSTALLNKEWFLNRVRLLKDVQYLSLMNLIKPTAVYILGHHWPEIYIAGYQLLRRDRYGKASGGIAIYVKDDLNCVRFIKYDVLILKLSGLKYVHSLSDCLLVVCTDLLTVLISLTNFAVLWEKSGSQRKMLW